MTVTIRLPEGSGVKGGYGTKVINDKTGEDISHMVSSIQINIDVESIITATMVMAVSNIENATGLEGIAVLHQDQGNEIECRQVDGVTRRIKVGDSYAKENKTES